MTGIRLWNSRIRARQALEPTVTPGRVGMYVCGPTVYDRAHLGNARPAVVFDVLFRLLRASYGADNVTYVRNITDVDDRINETARARRAAGAPGSLVALIHRRSDETIAWYRADMEALGVLRPTHEPRATDHVGDMVAMIERLIATGHAYEAAGHVLFSVASFPAYGALSGRSTEDMIAGARVEVAPWKRDPMDFVLWKPSDDDLPGWDSPWGRGRPGWHIECSAMSAALLGESFDIHGGGADLMFPHHENEIAQSCCAFPGSGFARIWMHNEMLQVEGKKMSKSLGNFFTVRDLLEQGVPGEVIRLVFLSSHYRKPMDWTAAKAAEAEAVLRRWRALTAGIESLRGRHRPQRCRQTDPRAGEAAALKASAGLMGLLADGMGDWAAAPVAGSGAAARIDALLAARAAARAARDFGRADAVRDGLLAAGVVLKDGPGGTEWEIGPGFDPALLPPAP